MATAEVETTEARTAECVCESGGLPAAAVSWRTLFIFFVCRAVVHLLSVICAKRRG